MLGETDLRSDGPSVHPDRLRLSSSLPRQRWSQPSSSSYSSPVVEAAGPSHEASSRHYESTLDESARAYRTTALRQLNGNHKPLSRRPRQANPSGGRSSTLASQPVLVRSYSGDTDDNNTRSSKMPSRLSFPFASSSRAQESRPRLPSGEEFSIDGILRAIEPNIRNTLDSIAEICGRSKLSLANEYGSHIAPLGEIRAPPGGLLTVDEVSSNHERQDDDNVVIYDDGHSLADGRDHSSLPPRRYLDNVRQAAIHHTRFQSMAPLPVGDGPQRQTQPEAPRTNIATNAGSDPDAGVEPLPTTKKFTTKSNSRGRDFLKNNTESTAEDNLQTILTPAIIAEVHLAAQAGPLNPHPVHPGTNQDQTGLDHDASRGHEGLSYQASNASALADLHALLNRLKRALRDTGSDSPHQPQLSAEMLLRAMLERANDQGSRS